MKVKDSFYGAPRYLLGVLAVWTVVSVAFYLSFVGAPLGLPGMTACSRMVGHQHIETTTSLRDIPSCDQGWRSKFDSEKMRWMRVEARSGERRGEPPWCWTDMVTTTVFRW